MDKAHQVQSISFKDKKMILVVDAERFEIDLTRHSALLAAATIEQQMKFEVSPSGYGIHWPEVDEDLSIDGLIGVVHHYPLPATTGQAC